LIAETTVTALASLLRRRNFDDIRRRTRYNVQSPTVVLPESFLQSNRRFGILSPFIVEEILAAGPKIALARYEHERHKNNSDETDDV
jgi:hypothetical protein